VRRTVTALKRLLTLLGRVKSGYLSSIIATMVAKNAAAYEPPKQTKSVLVYWRQPEEWAEVLHDWVRRVSFMDLSL
jgi:ESCRT-II complex subunit